MFALSSPIFDSAGTMVFPAGRSESEPVSRRARRVATLDGGAVMSDLGYSDLDRTLTLTIPSATRTQHDFVARLIATYQTAVLCCAFGAFEVLLSELTYERGKVSVTAEVLEVL